MEFKDQNECMYPEQAKRAVELGLVAGYADGTLRPKQPVTREESWLIDLRQHEMLKAVVATPQLVQRLLPSIVRIWRGGSIGSGSFVTADGTILTNAHVVGTAETVTVDIHGRESQVGRVLARDEELDLALVKVTGTFTPLKLAAEAVHGEFCLVLGNPGGEYESVSAGIVCHPDRGNHIQVDALVNPGNSGGACVNQRGELIGIPSHKIILPNFDNMSYAIKAGVAKAWIQKLGVKAA